MPFQPGETVGDYEVIEILGGGGMGAVYKVRNTISGRVEAMKVVLDNLQGDPEVTDRFLREIRVLATLEHPNIAGLRTAQRVNGQILMVMELVEGWTLHHMIAEQRLPVAHAVRWVHDALEGLQAAHERGIVHRDIKPANMMINPQGVVKLMDFGIARLATDSQLTKTGFTMGSLYYMSPEQINATDIDHRTDIYSMGVTLYQLVTGRRPFEGGSEYSIMAGHLNQAPTPPRELDPSLPGALNGIILTALEKDPARRFQSAAAMKTALAHVLESGALGAGGGVAAEASAQAAAPAPVAAAAADAPVQAAPAQRPPVQAAPVQAIARQGNGMRVLYILAGSLITIVVLIVAAMQVPKWLSTRAGQAPVAVTEPPAPQPPPLDPNAGPAPPPAPDPGEPPVPVPPTIPGAPVSTSPVQGTASKPAEGSTSVPALEPARPSGPRPGTEPPDASPPPVASSPPQAKDPPRTEPTPPLTPSPAPPAANAALEQARERLVLVATRVGAVRSSLDRLRQSQARMGLGLRQDWAAAEQRLIYRMDQAQGAADAGDAAAAGRHLDTAENELSKLERALGL
ncbi:MAG: serine/threonine-protein kinase [Bryobacteraceae bacterium]